MLYSNFFHVQLLRESVNQNYKLWFFCKWLRRKVIDSYAVNLHIDIEVYDRHASSFIKTQFRCQSKGFQFFKQHSKYFSLYELSNNPQTHFKIWSIKNCSLISYNIVFLKYASLYTSKSTLTRYQFSGHNKGSLNFL